MLVTLSLPRSSTRRRSTALTTSAGDGKRRRLSGSRIVTVKARSSDSGGSGADAAADTAVITAIEPAADAAVDDADRSALASHQMPVLSVVIMSLS